MLNQIVEANKAAAKQAALLKVGETALVVAGKAAGKALPPFLRGYTSEPVGKFVIGNLISLGTKHALKNNQKAQVIGDAALTAGIMALANQLDVEGLIDGIFQNVGGEAALAAIVAPADQA